jgi:predicted nucleotidyltransferase
MAMENSLDIILNTKTKVKIIRLFVSRTDDFRSSGREIAKWIKVSPPATHTALKELYNQSILNLEVIGKQHIYSLNNKNRIVKDILKPSFKKELSIKEDIKHFLNKKIEEEKIKHKLSSLILYGSLQRRRTTGLSDVDIAVIVKYKRDVKEIEDKFIENIGIEFSEYFGVHLDAYVKSKDGFVYRMKKHLPPVLSLMKSYSVIFGEDPLEFI